LEYVLLTPWRVKSHYDLEEEENTRYNLVSEEGGDLMVLFQEILDILEAITESTCREILWLV
jgi:hypothetical protein